MLRDKKDYNNTVMYKLSHKDWDDNNNFIYVGHTTNFIERKTQHKTCCNNEKGKSYDTTLYKYIRENGGWNEWDMILIEKYPCKGIREAEEREEYWRLYFDAKLNKKKCYITDAQLSEYQREYQKEYRENHREYQKEYQKEYKGNKKRLEYLKEYRENNKEKISEYQKEYRERRKDIKNKVYRYIIKDVIN